MYCLENGALPRTFAPDALALLARQEYPGNIRQLKNIVERVAIMCGESRITAQRVEELMRTKESRGNALLVQPRGLAQAKDELEREYVLTQLELNQWDIVRTAEILEVQRTNLYRKMRQLGIERK
jgi:two-component system nitrogen regulation response regulator NtrX